MSDEVAPGKGSEITISEQKELSDNIPSENKLDVDTTASEEINTTFEKAEDTTDNNNSQQKDTKSSDYDPRNVHYEGEDAIYTDPTTNSQFKWDKEKNEWIVRPTQVYGFEDDTHTYTDAEGVKYFWDKEKNAWFPKINDDFMAQYQMNYGFIDNTTPDPPKPKIEQPKEVPKVQGVKRKPSEPSWFEMDDSRNTKVYVSNLPLDITEEEFTELMQKCGIIMRDPHTNKLKIKLYSDSESNELKGDGLCTYIRVESVKLALELLDGTTIRNKKIKVERAKFQMKGTYDPKLKPKSKKRKDKDKLKKMQEKLFDWRPEKKIGERSKHERIVIVKNLFDPKDFDDDVGLILEFQQDLRTECAKCGDVRKVTIFDRHPEGVAQINMSEPEEADACVLLLNGRWFCKRQLQAEIWDGKTKFKIAETDSQISERLGNWDKFLEGDDKKENK